MNVTMNVTFKELDIYSSIHSLLYSALPQCGKEGVVIYELHSCDVKR